MQNFLLKLIAFLLLRNSKNKVIITDGKTPIILGQ